MEIKDRISAVRDRIRTAASASGRDSDSVRMVAVSKTKPAEQVESAISAGVTILGENYIQEAREKVETLSTHPVSWHFIGHLQTNKAKYAVKLFDLIHSLDTIKLAREIDKEAKKIDKMQKVLIQVNIGEESTKSGIASEDAVEFIEAVSGFQNLSIQGLMTMPPFFDDPLRARPYFETLADLGKRLQARNIPNVNMAELSMGMTGDFEVAIDCGSTLVRIGTAIFGRRE